MSTTYEEAIKLFEQVEGEGQFTRWESAMNTWGQDTSTEAILEYIDRVQMKRGIPYYQRVKAGGASFGPRVNSAGSYSGYSAEFTGSYADAIDSNVVVRGSVKTPVNTVSQTVGGANKMTFKTGLREAGTFAIGSVVPAVAAAGIGITLGKTIDSTLYNLNPDFWDSHGMSSLNPQTWNNITSNEDGIAGSLFDLVFGLDGDKTQAYIDEDALAYLSWWLSEQGVFDAADTAQATYTGSANVSDITQPVNLCPPGEVLASGMYNTYRSTGYICRVKQANKASSSYVVFSTSPITTEYLTSSGWRTATNPVLTFTTLEQGITVYYQELQATSMESSLMPTISRYVNSTAYRKIATIMFDGTIALPSSIDGIGDQTGATLPNTTGWNDVDSTKQSLQNQYPQLWDGAKHQDYVDKDGQNKNKTFIPINLPDVKNPTDTKPTSGSRSQTDPLVDPTTATDDLLRTIRDIITGIGNPNPPSTGTGDGPTTVTPVGSASSLWKIYNPTQAQVDSFGAWLWSSDFVDQIKKLFNDPMQGIIGIHKVFATPSIGGTATIKVGYLDSQVPSAWVDNQYTTINCGSVTLSEYFGNVFDYSPYTKVSLYLPFIGIVDLDVADIMRATISVTYHVDVLSGACLADVKVSRDSASAVLYQYSGSAIVTYPVSSGNYMGMVAGVLSVASGIAGTILSGGALAPALIGGAVGMSHLHTDVSHSGGFSGCAGAMASKKPYLIISRPQTAMADNYKHFTGMPANAHVILSNCSGMTKVKSVYVRSIHRATDEEKNMIESQLKTGVLV